LINEGFPTGEVIDAWKGADAEDKDFQFHNVGIEVKSSHKQDKLVKISNIRQLDTAGFDAVYLYYYSFAKVLIYFGLLIFWFVDILVC
jgi:hypothetical protein